MKLNNFLAVFFSGITVLCVLADIWITFPYTWAYIKSLPWQSWALVGGVLFSTVMTIVFMDRAYSKR